MPFKKGKSGNPKGRPHKGECLTDLLTSSLNEQDPLRKMTKKEALVQKLISLGICGDVTATKYIFDRLEGKPVERVITANDKTGKFFDMFEEDDEDTVK